MHAIIIVLRIMIISVELFVEKEVVCVSGRKTDWKKRNGMENGVVWFKRCDNVGGEEKGRVGLSVFGCRETEMGAGKS